MKCLICNKNEAVTKSTIKRIARCNECITKHSREYQKDWNNNKRKGNPLIYKIEYNGYVYVGSTKYTLKERLRLHFSHAFNDNHNMNISSFIRSNFSSYLDYKHNLNIISLIEYVDIDEMFIKERDWVNKIKPNLNNYMFKKDKIKKDKIIGSSHWRSKLNEDDVIEIRNLFNSGLSKNKISIKFGISPMTINQIVNRKTWRHI